MFIELHKLADKKAILVNTDVISSVFAGMNYTRVCTTTDCVDVVESYDDIVAHLGSSFSIIRIGKKEPRGR